MTAASGRGPPYEISISTSRNAMSCRVVSCHVPRLVWRIICLPLDNIAIATYLLHPCLSTHLVFFHNASFLVHLKNPMQHFRVCVCAGRSAACIGTGYTLVGSGLPELQMQPFLGFGQRSNVSTSSRHATPPPSNQQYHARHTALIIPSTRGGARRVTD